jgi:hypothetical protein
MKRCYQLKKHAAPSLKLSGTNYAEVLVRCWLISKYDMQKKHKLRSIAPPTFSVPFQVTTLFYSNLRSKNLNYLCDELRVSCTSRSDCKLFMQVLLIILLHKKRLCRL